MRAYRWSVRLKLGLILFAGLIALASLWYTQRLVNRLQQREQAVIQLWADALEQVAQTRQGGGNPYLDELGRLEDYLARVEKNPTGPSLSADQLQAYRDAVQWAQGMPPMREFNFVLNEILKPNQFGVPAIIADSTRTRPLSWRNVGGPVPDTLGALSRADSAKAMRRLRDKLQDMKSGFDPIRVQSGAQTQYLYYKESALVTELRLFPWIQLVFVGLFILVGYLGFSYVRRSEQSSLWMGMAREAAHQLGTPLSSLMGWIEMLRSSDVDPERKEKALEEIESDVERLHRVTDRFSDIGSQPKLERCDLVPNVEQTVDYLRRRVPRKGQTIDLSVEMPEQLHAVANEELFAWVLENLLKNALDAIEAEEGSIAVTGWREEGTVYIEVSDTGSGIDRRQWKNVFRPGFSTKKRGWGLGLSLARRVVESYHGGRLRLMSSTVGEGSTFRIELPAADRENDRAD